MSLLRRDPLARRLHDEVLPRVLERGERLLAWAELDVPDQELFVLATDRALLAPGLSGWERLPWASIIKATYADEVLGVTEHGASRPRSYPVRDARTLAPVVRARVEASIAWSQHHALAASRVGGVLVVARREEGGGLRWSLQFDEGVDQTNPAVVEEARELLHAARASAGSL